MSVLIVDDDEWDADSIRALLRTANQMTTWKRERDKRIADLEGAGMVVKLPAGSKLEDIVYALEKRNAELEALVSDMHATQHRVTFTAETIIGGVRYSPGEFVLMRIGPVRNDDPHPF